MPPTQDAVRSSSMTKELPASSSLGMVLVVYWGTGNKASMAVARGRGRGQYLLLLRSSSLVLCEVADQILALDPKSSSHSQTGQVTLQSCVLSYHSCRSSTHTVISRHKLTVDLQGTPPSSTFRSSIDRAVRVSVCMALCRAEEDSLS